jgi:hypothetical protein
LSILNIALASAESSMPNRVLIKAATVKNSAGGMFDRVENITIKGAGGMHNTNTIGVAGMHDISVTGSKAGDNSAVTVNTVRVDMDNSDFTQRDSTYPSGVVNAPNENSNTYVKKLEKRLTELEDLVKEQQKLIELYKEQLAKNKTTQKKE